MTFDKIVSNEREEIGATENTEKINKEDTLVNNPSEIFPTLIGQWMKKESFLLGAGPVTITETIEFCENGAGIWRQWDNSGMQTQSSDSFVYQITGTQILFRYSSQPKHQEKLDFRIVDGCLVLIANHAMPNESFEVFSIHLTS